jgi:diguanylate cyclase (GGDEF)-like protein
MFMKKKPIFLKILGPMMLLVIIEILVLIGSIYGQGIIETLDTNEENIVTERVIRRKDFLENQMVNSWMNLSYTVELINQSTANLLHTDEISLETLEGNSGSYTPLLATTAEYLISLLRTNRVTGAFLILNMGDLDEAAAAGESLERPCLYLRDSDPVSPASTTNQDLLVERGPISVVQDLNIPADSSWNVKLETQADGSVYDLLYQPYQTALHNERGYTWSDMGYWSTPYRLSGEEKWLISYSVPLILEDGTVYGVLGIDISYDYLKTVLPNSEVNQNGLGAYILARSTGETGCYSYAFGDNRYLLAGEDGTLRMDSDFYYHEEALTLYNSNTPFVSEQWVLIGTVPYSELRSFSSQVNRAVVYAVAVSFILGIAGCLLTSYVLQRPLSRLSKQIQAQDPRASVSLEPTGIWEVDQMSEAIEQLSMDMIESGRKFTKIIEMASVNLAGFQVDYDKGNLFLTEDFFSIFLMRGIDTEKVDIETFEKLLRSLDGYIREQDAASGYTLYRIPEGNTYRFVSLRTRTDQKIYYGLAEDVTQSMLEKEILKHERDHDPLTNLYNRRAFRRRMQELFREKEKLQQGAFLMFDLDNLKYINDTHGHEYGDKYIRKAANVFPECLPEQSVYARISGDEFNVFIYGCPTREALQEKIDYLRKGIDELTLELPNGHLHRIHMSGGVAWYPQDSDQYDELLKYADFAMYSAKREHKGEIMEFEPELYRGQNKIIRNKELLDRLIEQEAVQYAFQPIVDAHTGQVFGYEALMRPTSAGFENVGEILNAALEEGKLIHIERLTWFVGMRQFVSHIKAGSIADDCHLFINSIPNQRMGRKLEEAFYEMYSEYMHLLVMELTEEEEAEYDIWDGKQDIIRENGGLIALDDYGTGYNSEKMLLAISPDFIKVDIAIVKDIHMSADKRAIVTYIVNYAHERGKYIIAEGVETEEEVKTVIELGVDYLQGFYLARPQLSPNGIPEEKSRMIQTFAKSFSTS